MMSMKKFVYPTDYRKSSIRSRPCIILDPKIPRLVLEVLYKVQLLEQKVLNRVREGPMRSPKKSTKNDFDDIRTLLAYMV